NRLALRRSPVSRFGIPGAPVSGPIYLFSSALFVGANGGSKNGGCPGGQIPNIPGKPGGLLLAERGFQHRSNSSTNDLASVRGQWRRRPGLDRSDSLFCRPADRIFTHRLPRLRNL